MIKRAKGPGRDDTRDSTLQLIATLKLLDARVGSVTALTDTEEDVLDAVSECLNGAIRGLKRLLAHRAEQRTG